MRLVDFMLCDDIRFEQYNKMSLMGIYNEALHVEAEDLDKIKWPIGVKLGIYIRLLREQDEVLKKGAKYLFSLTVRKDGKVSEELAKAEGECSPVDEASPYISLPLVLPPLAITGPCKLMFEFKFGDATLATPTFEIRTRRKQPTN